MKVAIYCRVSDVKKKEDGERRQDIGRQVEMLTKYYLGKGIAKEDIAVYQDDGKSAYTDDLNQRPDFKRLLNDCRRYYVKEFAIEDMTRFSRNLSMGLSWIKELGQLNVNIISMREGEIDCTSSAGWMKSAITLLFAEWDSRIKSEKVQSGMRKAKNLGKTIHRPKTKGGVENPPILPQETHGSEKLA
jgi:site-specific DNA recombinase